MLVRDETWRQRCRGAAKIATLCGPIFISGCAGNRYDFMDHTALVLRPSHKQALLAYSFGGNGESSQDAAMDVRRNVAASLAAAMNVNDSPLPTINTDTMDFKGGRLYIHTPRGR